MFFFFKNNATINNCSKAAAIRVRNANVCVLKMTTSTPGAREYVRALQAALDLHLSVGIFRIQGGFDISSLGLTESPDGQLRR
jgi:hypothetical protein